MPSKLKATPWALPTTDYPRELVDQFVSGPMTAEAAQNAAIAF